jgi:hypothetical protein
MKIAGLCLPLKPQKERCLSIKKTVRFGLKSTVKFTKKVKNNSSKQAHG